MTVLVLASASPARLGLLRAAGIEPVVRVSDVDEDAVISDRTAELGPGGRLDPTQIAAELACAKATAVRNALVASEPQTASALVVGADSVLEWDGRTWGKPQTAKQAIDRWTAMRGSTGILHTGHHVVDLPTGRSVHGVASTTILFGDVTDAEIRAYVATGESLKVAGGFTLDGLSAPFVDGVEGDPSNVIGLSLPLLRRLVRELGFEWTDLWNLVPTTSLP
ncbi:MAG: nucleoside triphosphate pyrophosphatase [Actinomycetes bacterium]